MRDSRETFVNHAFVAGHPIAHSRSPLIHKHWLKTFGIAGDYSRLDVAPGDFPAFMENLRAGNSGYCGGNVTIPHKEMACRLADRPSELARELGAANTLWLEDGAIHATNTDGFGFTANLDQQAPGWDRQETAVVLGAGGASRAIIQAVRDRGFNSIRIVNRTLEKARELADRFGEKVSAHPQEALGEVMTGAGLFINTTSLGMKGQPALEIDFSPLSAGAIVTDIVYIPLVTPFLRQAGEQGFKTVDGLGMLLHQAAPGFEKWFGRRPAVDAGLRQIVIGDMGEPA